MDSEQWRRVDGLLQAMMASPPEEREAFLRRSCDGDQALERESAVIVGLAAAGEELSGEPWLCTWPRGQSLLSQSGPPSELVLNLGTTELTP